MSLSPCAYRSTGANGREMNCALVQRILGLDGLEGCGVEIDACRACGSQSVVEASRPGVVVSSLVHNLARKIRQGDGCTDCDAGQAWQVECYVLPFLTDESRTETVQATPNVAFRKKVWSGIPSASRSASEASSGAKSKIGLVGHAVASGLGSINLDLATCGGIDSWLIVEHPRYGPLDLTSLPCKSVHLKSEFDTNLVRDWLADIDWLVWAEVSPIDYLPQLAKRMGVRTACIPMWEWTSPNAPWLRDVDLLICPSLHAFQMFSSWKTRFGFCWQVAFFPWPIAHDRFPFRVRERCQRFLYVHGHGGACARSIENGTALGARKGLDIVMEAAQLTPEIPWRICTQVELDFDPPSNVEVVYGVDDSATLYDIGDVCVQPSRWEGLGLPLLECQAAGMPLITVDAPPMNEYFPIRRLTPTGWDFGALVDGQPICVPRQSASELAAFARQLHGCDIRRDSIQARDWIRRERSWEAKVDAFKEVFAAAETRSEVR